MLYKEVSPANMFMLSIAKNLLYNAKKSEISPRLLGWKTLPLRWRWEDCPSFAKRDEQQRCGGSSITTTLRQHNAQTKPRICHSERSEESLKLATAEPLDACPISHRQICGHCMLCPYKYASKKLSLLKSQREYGFSRVGDC